jgi:hypothetical protein
MTTPGDIQYVHRIISKKALAGNKVYHVEQNSQMAVNGTLVGKRHIWRKAWKKLIQGTSVGGLNILHRPDVMVVALLQVVDLESFNSLTPNDL